MRYKLSSGIEIRAENAAKSAAQPSRFLLKILSELPPVVDSFDYGCGKLRYFQALTNTTDTLSLIDSEIQISRHQIILGEKNSIRKMMSNYNHIDVYNNFEFKNIGHKYDRGFCINVLSVIPCFDIRREVLNTIRERLKKNSRCLFSVQYRNSDFKRMQKMPNTQPFLDGFIVDSYRGYSFYGLIPPKNLQSLLINSGFKILDIKINDGSVFMWASPL